MRRRAGQHLVEVALDHVLVRLDRVDVGAEGEARCDVHRIAHEVGLQVDRVARLGRALPAPREALRDFHQRGEVGLDVRRVEARHHHRPLPPPLLAVGGEDPAEAHFPRRAVQALGALEAVGPVAQHRGDRLGVGDDEELAAGDAEAEVVAVPAVPCLDHQVQAPRIDLQRVAEQRQARRSRQVADLA